MNNHPTKQPMGHSYNNVDRFDPPSPLRGYFHNIKVYVSKWHLANPLTPPTTVHVVYGCSLMGHHVSWLDQSVTLIRSFSGPVWLDLALSPRSSRLLWFKPMVCMTISMEKVKPQDTWTRLVTTNLSRFVDLCRSWLKNQ